MSRFESESFTNLERDPVPHLNAPEEPTVLEVVEVDTHIERADLGPGNYTFVAGDAVPVELTDLPRQPASGPPSGLGARPRSRRGVNSSARSPRLGRRRRQG